VVWKQAIIVLILKPGKPADHGLSYQPISLLSPVAKILEHLIKPKVLAALPKHSSQHAYAPMHSTATSLLPLATQVAICFNDNKPPRRCAMVAIDIAEAFDSVDHTIILDEVSNSTLDSNYIRWLAAYLRGQSASCSFNGAMSQRCKVKSGFPQGSVLSRTCGMLSSLTF
jgi:hypothetical protein